MRRRFSADKALHFNKKKKSNKNILHLSMLATEARNNIDENQQLSETFDILENLVKKTKSILCKLTSKKNISKTEIMDNLKEGETKISCKQYSLNGTVSVKFNETEFKKQNPKTYEKYCEETITYKLSKMNLK